MRFLALILLWLPATALAGDHVHTLREGETLDDLAKAYYGSTWKAVYIAAKNGISEGKEAAVGKRLVIPAAWLYKVKKGDQLSNIAKKHLGKSELYTALMQENNLKSPADLEVGQELLLPFNLRHTVEPGEGLSHIARKYYRNTRRAQLLKDWNGGGDQLSPGDKLTVPIFDRATLDPKSRKPNAPPPKESPPAPTALESAVSAATSTITKISEVATEVAKDTSPKPDMRVEIRKAVDGWRRGEFDDACPELERLLGTDGLATADRATVVSHLGFCAVATGDRPAARDYFKKWLELDHKAQLDPITTSPKILEVFQDVATTMRPVEPDGQP